MAYNYITTGQFVQIAQERASIGDRIVARLIDYAIIVLWYIFWSVMLTKYGAPDWLYVVLMLLPAFCYSFLWESLNNGQSAGKMVMRIRVVRLDGQETTMGNYFMRWILEAVDIYCGCVGLLVMAISRKGQRLGDMAAGTMVAKISNYEKYRPVLDEFGYARRNYKPRYPEVEDLSQKQVEVIEKALELDDSDKLDKLAGKVASVLGVKAERNSRQFLQTVLHDYQFYAAELL